jgi:molybdopterin synthase catalytic subunit
MTSEIEKVELHSTQRVTLDEIVKKFKHHPRFREAGAIITFTGIVKGVARDGKELNAIEIEPSEKTLANLKALCEEYEKKPGVLEVQYHLNTGELDISDPIMHIAIDTTVDGPDIQNIFDTLFEILDKAKKITGIKLKERSKEGWYYTRPKDKSKSFD